MNCQEHHSNGSQDQAENVHWSSSTVHLIIDRSQQDLMFVDNILEVKDINFMSLKLTVSHTDCQSLVLCGLCMPCKLT